MNANEPYYTECDLFEGYGNKAQGCKCIVKPLNTKTVYEKCSRVAHLPPEGR